jgi:aminoglycoside/choline kinase family phosphotransferase
MNETKALKVWLSGYGIDAPLQPLTGDASLRKYYRITDALHSGMVMDASAQPESVAPFVDIAHRLQEAGVRTPKIHAFDAAQGFVFMEDLGSRHFYDAIAAEGLQHYPKAVETIANMQRADVEGLPPYDRAFLHVEMDLMPQWYLGQYLHISLTQKERSMIETVFEAIADVVLQQPQDLFVHRDYHSRNLMFTPEDEIIVIDFQDARAGALTYDLVSLLRDVYVALNADEVRRLALYFRDLKGLDADDDTFMKWFDFTGLQRHIKILGIFARLALRDGKTGYLEDIPLTLKYISEVGSRYEETQILAEYIKEVSL